MTAAAPTFDKPDVTAPPIFDNLLKVLSGQVPSRPTLFEFFLNQPLYERLAGHPAPAGGGHSLAYVRWLIEAFGHAGYDYTTYQGSAITVPRGDDHVGGFRAAGGTLIHDRLDRALLQHVGHGLSLEDDPEFVVPCSLNALNLLTLKRTHLTDLYAVLFLEQRIVDSA